MNNFETIILNSNRKINLKPRINTNKLAKPIKPLKPIKPIKVKSRTIDVKIDLSTTYMENNYLFPEDEEWIGTVDIKTIIY